MNPIVIDLLASLNDRGIIGEVVEGTKVRLRGKRIRLDISTTDAVRRYKQEILRLMEMRDGKAKIP